MVDEIWPAPLYPKVDTPLFATTANPLLLYHSPRVKILAFESCTTNVPEGGSLGTQGLHIYHEHKLYMDIMTELGYQIPVTCAEDQIANAYKTVTQMLTCYEISKRCQRCNAYGSNTIQR